MPRRKKHLTHLKQFRHDACPSPSRAGDRSAHLVDKEIQGTAQPPPHAQDMDTEVYAHLDQKQDTKVYAHLPQRQDIEVYAHPDKKQSEVYAHPNKRQSEVYAHPNKKQCKDSPSGCQELVANHEKSYSKPICIAGNFHQGDKIQFSPESVGKQCACNALMAICTLPVLTKYVPETLDSILIEGDQLYKDIQHTLPYEDQYQYLCFEQLPLSVPVHNPQYIVTKHLPIYLHKKCLNETKGIYQSLDDAIACSLYKSNTVLLMVGENAISLFKKGGEFYVFDSHSRDRFGHITSDGHSVLLQFHTMNQLIKFFTQMFHDLLMDHCPVVECLPVTIHSVSTDGESWIHTYLSKQADRMEEGKQKLGAEYNRLYKQKQRSVAEFRNKEKAVDCERKQKARVDPVQKQKEHDRYQKTKVDPVHIQKELERKQRVRMDPEQKQKELEHKQKMRMDPEQKRKEHERYQKAKVDPVHIQKELERKQKMRMDPEQKQKELEHKQKMRMDPEQKQKEHERYQKAKVDPVHIQKELERKQKMRMDPEQKQKEHERYQKTKVDPVHIQKELERKQKMRIDPEQKQKECEHKQKMRMDPKQKQKECEHKQKMRMDPKQKQKECKQKQKMRMDPEQKQKELEHKQRMRTDPEYKQKERMSKKKARVSVSYCHSETRRCTPVKSKSGNGNEPGTLENCISSFLDSVAMGPVYICTCCHQTWFRHSVVNTSSIKSVEKEIQEMCFTRRCSVDDKEWLCITCHISLKQGKIPRLAVINGLKFPDKPPELYLHPLEERLISLRIPFMTLYELPRGGQLQMQGSVVNVPVDIAPVVQSLPRTLDNAATVPIKLKRKLSYKKCVYHQNVRPMAVLAALHYLMTKDLYKNANIDIDENWMKEFLGQNYQGTSSNTTDEDEDDYDDDTDGKSDTFSEVDPDETSAGNQDSMLEEQNIDHLRTLSFAPGEGKSPMSLFQDKDAEFLSFPTTYCGERMIYTNYENENEELPYSELSRWELRAVDRRVANSVPHIFFKAKKLQIEQIARKGTLAMKRVQSKGNIYTAGQILDESTKSEITRLDEGYYIFRTIRNSPPYLDLCKKDIMAMIRQLGIPQWFMSLSAADTHWTDLIIMLGKLNDQKDYTDDLKAHRLDWQNISRLVSSDPVTCARYFNDRVHKFIQNVLKSKCNPIGIVKDFVFRVEFQHRGSPHIHMLVWLDGAPIYGTDTSETIALFIDKFVSCSAQPETHREFVNNQLHRHSKSCRKKGKALCRFGFPLPPMPHTVLLEPYAGLNRDDYEKLYEKIKKNLDQMKEGTDQPFEMFMSEMKCSLTEYLSAISTSIKGPTVFLKRSLKEIRINPYMKNLLGAWRANHDIQFVTDAYACATYITNYISKCQKGMSTLLQNAVKEARKGNESLRKQVRFIGNVFLNASEMSAQEAVYLTLQLPLVKKTRQVIFINTSPPEERTRLLKSEEMLKELPEDSTDIYSSNQLIRYSQRPKQLENWCLADYVSKLTVQYPRSMNKTANDPHQDNCEDQMSDSEDSSESDTGEDESTDTNTINITLKNGIIIKSVQVPRIIRYVRYNEKVDAENYHREQLLLFWPWRDESVDLLGGTDSYSAFYQKVLKHLQTKRTSYDHKSEILDHALLVAESENLPEDGDVSGLAPNIVQQECDDERQGCLESERFGFFDPSTLDHPPKYDIGSDITAMHADQNKHLRCMADVDYYALIRSLNIKQREFVLHVNHWVRTKKEPLRVFLTGGAGVGKSVVIKALYESLHRYLIRQTVDDLDHIRVLKCAPTGTAAYNIEGVTVHHAFTILVKQQFQPLSAEQANSLYNKYKHLSVVIIDEISLVSNVIFKQIDERLQQIKKCEDPFGGVHLILVGDLFQLEPVSYSWIFRNLKKGYGPLATNLWNKYIHMYELTEIMRQKDDKKFAEILSRLREGIQTERDIEELKKRCIDASHPQYPHNAAHMFRTNDEVTAFNNSVYDKARTEKVVVDSISTVIGDVTDAVKTTTMQHLTNDIKYRSHTETGGLMMKLRLAVGLYYDCTVNLDVEDGLTNGATCTIMKIEYKPETKSENPAIVWVKFINDKIGLKCRLKYRHLFLHGIDKQWTPIFAVKRTFSVFHALVCRQQFPLCPSSARTIHRNQGSTLNCKTVIHMGQTKLSQSHYTALSRVTTITNLYILELNEGKISVYNSVKEEMRRLRTKSSIKLCYQPVYMMSSTCTHVVFHNVRSLHAHFLHIQCDPNYTSADVIAFVETRLTTADDNSEYELPNFQPIVRNDQKQTSQIRPPHGIAVFIKMSYSILQAVHYSDPHLEYSIIVIDRAQNDILQVVVIYKAHNCPVVLLKQCMCDIAKNIDMSKSFIVIGDFNIDAQVSANKTLLLEIEKILRCRQLMVEDTTMYKTTIDLVFSNISTITVGTIESLVSDHKMVTAQC